MKNKILLTAVIVFILDQFIKTLAFNYLNAISIIPGFFGLIFAKNEGAAFSILWGNRWLIVIVTIVILLFLTYNILKERKSIKKYIIFYDVTYGLLFGGILGNLFDRILRGYVIDYISLNILGYSFPIFNIADITITLGVILMIIYMLFFENKEKTEQ